MLKLCCGSFSLSFSIWFFVQLFCCFVLFSGGEAGLFLLLCFGHEAAHAAAALCCGVKISALCFGAGSVKMAVPRPPTAAQQRYISAAGPIFNVIAAVVLALFGRAAAARFSLLLAAFNLLPAGDTDGAVLTEQASPAVRCVLGAFLGVVLLLCAAVFCSSAAVQQRRAMLIFFLSSLLQQKDAQMGYTNAR